MTTPTHETRDPDPAENEPEARHRIDLSVTKIAAGACAAALAAAVGSKLGVAGTIAGAAVASVVATSASAVIGHSLERGTSAARKAMPVLDPEQLETAILSRARTARAEHRMPHDTRVHDVRIQDTRVQDAAALTHTDQTRVLPSLADRALTDSGLDETVVLDRKPLPAVSPHAQTVVLPTVTPDVPDTPDTPDTPRTWKDRLPGRKPLLAAAVASFLIGTGAVTALEVARKGEFPGYHSNVFTNDPGQSGGSHNQPGEQNPGGAGTHESSTPSQKPDSSAPTPSGSSDAGTTPSTPQSSDSAPSTPDTPSTGSSTGSSASPTTAPSSSANPSSIPSTPNPPTQSSSADGAGKSTPTGGPTG
ncbi:hypothetical protein ABH926_010282 [Catenulispora sp. GP43]|uniref:hypothetical protein n=1 Tax=Catenulispora sp. GP43 TaxID=3156263 RepID=UPI0035163345